MKILKASLMAAMVGLMSISGSSTVAQTKAAPTIPVEAWALRDIVTNVELSPSGEHLLVLSLKSKEGDYLLEVYETANLSKPLRALNAKPMEIISARWVSDNYIFGTAWEVKRKRVKFNGDDVRERLSYFYNLEKNSFSQVDGDFGYVSPLPKEPDAILIGTGTEVEGAFGVDPLAEIRPRSYYKLNLKNGSRRLVLKGSEKHRSASFDLDGNPRFSGGFDAGSNELVYYYRAVGDGSWKEFSERVDYDDYDNLYRRLGGPHGFAGISGEDPNKGYFIDNRNGDDKTALYEFDFLTGQVGEKIFETPDSDVMRIQSHSMSWAGNNKMVAARFPGAKMERHWFDMEEKELYENLEREIPFSHSIGITSRSRDGKTMIVYNSGPRDPGSYWFVKDEKMVKLGSRNPLVNQKLLSDVEYIRYPARDGRIIPAYVTKPAGEGPFPLIVLPHGGPHVNEIIGYDEWGQLLANAGYMILQPQYRMSTGWGQDHFDSAYGQHGLAMQDDKDDGALHLVKLGLVDPDRMAMFGWSYGGYAALVATSREDQIYQCAVAGAAVADPAKSFNSGNKAGLDKPLKDWAERRGTIGINPINEVEKTNIPLLMVHGDVDNRVLYFHYKDYKKAMEAASNAAPSEYLTLEGADHFYTTLMYNHQEAFFTKMLDFLANDCGPGGL
jgi:dipeptidyl aminopeptidase/acylaminoacyl peptidase